MFFSLLFFFYKKKRGGISDTLSRSARIRVCCCLACIHRDVLIRRRSAFNRIYSHILPPAPTLRAAHTRPHQLPTHAATRQTHSNIPLVVYTSTWIRDVRHRSYFVYQNPTGGRGLISGTGNNNKNNNGINYFRIQVSLPINLDIASRSSNRYSVVSEI